MKKQIFIRMALGAMALTGTVAAHADVTVGISISATGSAAANWMLTK